ncbi:hypothetical protein [Nostoc sp.]|uniref:hypothetical protein n=1 Tax=Nostoc sp. TaxID=1180 RepID=UPI002FF5D993
MRRGSIPSGDARSPLASPLGRRLANAALTAVAHGGDPQERAASPKSKLRWKPPKVRPKIQN